MTPVVREGNSQKILVVAKYINKTLIKQTNDDA